MPPKTCLATTMARKAPTTPIHQGAQGGRVMASSQPVSRAEPSSRKGRTRFPARRSEAASNSRQANRVMTKRKIAGQPNR